MKKALCLALALIMAATALVGCAKKDDDWSYIKGKKEIVIGYTDYQPMNYTDDSGKLIGFDTEYAEAVCAKLGVTPKFVIINWDTKEVELAAKTIDCIWNGLTVTEERREKMAFTTSYIVNEQVLVVKSDNASKYADKASLSGVAVVAEIESAGQSAIEKDLPDAAFTAVDTQATALLEVKAGTAEAAVIDATMAEAMTGEGSDYSDLVVVTSVDLMDEEYAIGLRLGSTAVAEFNKVTEKLLADGTLQAIAEKYGLGARLISK
ncbi:MAG: transporter substrate-binding domain-containing protein [Clostridiales bacterium]|nr:transporter substrate-binding domain-containing protein [Clostridiales bacterium]